MQHQQITGYAAVAVMVTLGSTVSPAAAHEICGDPPPVANEALRGEIEGEAQLLSRLIGSGELAGEVQTSRSEIFSRYPDAEKSRSNAYYEYIMCVAIMDDSDASMTEKIDELLRVRLALREPVTPEEPPAQNIPPDVTQFTLKDDETTFLLDGRHWFTFEHGRTANAGCIRVVLDGEGAIHCIGKPLTIEDQGGQSCGIIYLGKSEDGASANFALRCEEA